MLLSGTGWATPPAGSRRWPACASVSVAGATKPFLPVPGGSARRALAAVPRDCSLTQEERRQLSEQSRGAAKARRAEPLGAGKKGFVAPATETEAQAGQRRLPAGGLVQPVPESSMTDLMIVRGADGQLRMGHADDASKLQQAKEASDE